MSVEKNKFSKNDTNNLKFAQKFSEFFEITWNDIKQNGIKDASYLDDEKFDGMLRNCTIFFYKHIKEFLQYSTTVTNMCHLVLTLYKQSVMDCTSKSFFKLITINCRIIIFHNDEETIRESCIVIKDIIGALKEDILDEIIDKSTSSLPFLLQKLLTVRTALSQLMILEVFFKLTSKSKTKRIEALKKQKFYNRSNPEALTKLITLFGRIDLDNFAVTSRSFLTYLNHNVYRKSAIFSCKGCVAIVNEKTFTEGEITYLDFNARANSVSFTIERRIICSALKKTNIHHSKSRKDTFFEIKFDSMKIAKLNNNDVEISINVAKVIFKRYLKDQFKHIEDITNMSFMLTGTKEKLKDFLIFYEMLSRKASLNAESKLNGPSLSTHGELNLDAPVPYLHASISQLNGTEGSNHYTAQITNRNQPEPWRLKKANDETNQNVGSSIDLHQKFSKNLKQQPPKKHQKSGKPVISFASGKPSVAKESNYNIESGPTSEQKESNKRKKGEPKLPKHPDHFQNVLPEIANTFITQLNETEGARLIVNQCKTQIAKLNQPEPWRLKKANDQTNRNDGSSKNLKHPPKKYDKQEKVITSASGKPSDVEELNMVMHNIESGLIVEQKESNATRKEEPKLAQHPVNNTSIAKKNKERPTRKSKEAAKNFMTKILKSQLDSDVDESHETSHETVLKKTASVKRKSKPDELYFEGSKGNYKKFKSSKFENESHNHNTSDFEISPAGRDDIDVVESNKRDVGVQVSSPMVHKSTMTRQLDRDHNDKVIMPTKYKRLQSKFFRGEH